MDTLHCYVFACVCIHAYVDICGICVCVSLCICVCPDNPMQPCMYVYGIHVCAWICLAHSKCSINILKISILYYTRMWACFFLVFFLHSQWLRTMWGGGVGYIWLCSAGTSPGCTWTLGGKSSHTSVAFKRFTHCIPMFPLSWTSSYLDHLKGNKTAGAHLAGLWWCWDSHCAGPGKARAAGGIPGSITEVWSPEG